MPKPILKLIPDARFSELLTGSIWTLSAQLSSAFLGLVFSIAVARLYGAEMVGTIAVINSFLIITTIVTVFGTPTALLRLIPEQISKFSVGSAFKLYRKVLMLTVVISLLATAILFCQANGIADKLFSKPRLSHYFALASFIVVFRSLYLLSTEAIRGLKRIRIFALLQVLPQSLNILLLFSISFFWPHNDAPIHAVLVSFALNGALGWLIVEYLFNRLKHQGEPIQPMALTHILGISLPILISTSMDIVIGWSGIILLGIFRNEVEVGYFSICLKLSGLTTYILSAVNSLAAPEFSRLYHTDKMEDLFAMAKKSAKIVFWSTLPILLIFILFGKPILSTFFGEKFVVAYIPLIVLVFGRFISSISGSTGIFMNMTGNQVVFRNIMILSAVICMLANLFLIPQFGSIGAAVSFALSICIWNIITLIYIKVKFRKTIGYLPCI